jgi:hypothetical protein
MSRSLLMPYQDVPDIVLGHFMVDVDDGPSRKAEDDFHPFSFETFEEDLCPRKLHD